MKVPFIISETSYAIFLSKVIHHEYGQIYNFKYSEIGTSGRRQRIPPPKLSLDNSKQNLGNLTSLLHFHASAFQSFLDCVEQNRTLENVLVRIWTMLTTLCMSLSCYVIGQN